MENGVKKEIAVEIPDAADQTLHVLLGEKEEVHVRTKIQKSVKAPVEKGMPVGQVDYEIGGIILASDPIVTEESTEEWTFAYTRRQVMGKFWL